MHVTSDVFLNATRDFCSEMEKEKRMELGMGSRQALQVTDFMHGNGVRCFEIITRREKVGRGIFCGSVQGYGYSIHTAKGECVFCCFHFIFLSVLIPKMQTKHCSGQVLMITDTTLPRLFTMYKNSRLLYIMCLE